MDADLSVGVPRAPSREAPGHGLCIGIGGGLSLSSQLPTSSIPAPSAGVGALAPNRGRGSAGLGDRKSVV